MLHTPKTREKHRVTQVCSWTLLVLVVNGTLMIFIRQYYRICFASLHSFSQIFELYLVQVIIKQVCMTERKQNRYYEIS